MGHQNFVCAACRVGVPLAKGWTTTWALGALGVVGGGAKTKNLGAAIATGIVGLAVGAAIDILAKPICGRCASGAMA